MKKIIIRIAIAIFLILNIVSLPPVMNFFGEISYPGFQSRDLNDLQPSFHKKLSNVIERLEDDGYPIWVGGTWRDKERQQFYKDKGYSETLNSRHRGGGEEKGTRRSKAADIYLNVPMIYLPLHAHFYHRLSQAAKKEGLTTGASFTKRNPVWAFFGLGWDPGHVQTP